LHRSASSSKTSDGCAHNRLHARQRRATIKAPNSRGRSLVAPALCYHVKDIAFWGVPPTSLLLVTWGHGRVVPVPAIVIFVSFHRRWPHGYPMSGFDAPQLFSLLPGWQMLLGKSQASPPPTAPSVIYASRYLLPKGRDCRGELVRCTTLPR
jgi:hypothetical protein